MERLAISHADRQEAVTREKNSGVSVRVFAGGGSAFATADSPEQLDEWLPGLIQQAGALGSAGDHPARVAPLKRRSPLRLRLDPRCVSLTEKRDFIHSLHDRCLAHPAGIAQASASYEEQIIRRIFVNSDGTETQRHFLDLQGSFSATAIQGDVRQFDFESTGSNRDYAVVLGLGGMVDSVCTMANALSRAPKVEPGRYDVVLDHLLAGVFVHEAFGHTAEADSISSSPERMRLLSPGTVLGSRKLTIYDTGRAPGSRGHLPFDDEGVLCERSMLIERGVVTGLLHSRLTANRMKMKPTGSARALDVAHPPIVRMRCTCIAQGRDHLEDMISGIDDGLYCCKSKGGIGGEMFTFTTLYSRRIKNGKLGELVRDATLSGNLFTTLREIDGIGNDFRVTEMAGGCGKDGQFPLPVSAGSPHIRIRGVIAGGG